MSKIGTPFSSTAKRAVLCGSGELGKEVVIELQRLGIEVIALDSYANAPAMQVADRSHVLNMLDRHALRAAQPRVLIEFGLCGEIAMEIQERWRERRSCWVG